MDAVTSRGFKWVSVSCSNGYAVAVKRSLGADATMAMLASIGCTFLGMYVYYLRAGLKKVNSQNYKDGFYVQLNNLIISDRLH